MMTMTAQARQKAETNLLLIFRHLWIGALMTV